MLTPVPATLPDSTLSPSDVIAKFSPQSLAGLGYGPFGFGFLGDDDDSGDDSGPDDLTSVLASLPTPGGPSALGTSVTCTGSNEQLLNNVCYDFTPLTSPGSGPGTASPNAATLAAGSYYTTGGNVVTPGTGNNGIPAGSYQVFNPNTGAVFGTTTSAPVQVNSLCTSSNASDQALCNLLQTSTGSSSAPAASGGLSPAQYASIASQLAAGVSQAALLSQLPKGYSIGPNGQIVAPGALSSSFFSGSSGTILLFLALGVGFFIAMEKK